MAVLIVNAIKQHEMSSKNCVSYAVCVTARAKMIIKAAASIGKKRTDLRKCMRWFRIICRASFIFSCNDCYIGL